MSDAPLVPSRLVGRAIAAIDAVACRPWLAMAICAATSFVGSAAVATFVMWPLPHVHDEFSYLLAADTFAHGRVANPTHPLWHHFESFHIFHEPTYGSKYPPAQGLVLALGIVLAGEPLLGVWLSGALLCASICWLLYALVTPRWAFLGGLAATMQIGIATAWTQTFWGGALAAAGSAIVLGAGIRLARAPSRASALQLALGLLLLANTRPYEGAITSLAVAAYLAVSFRHDPATLVRSLSVIAVVLALWAAAMAAYNQAVVGRWYMPPYVHHELLYVVQPTFAVVGDRRPVEFRNAPMRQFYWGLGGGDSDASASSATTAPATGSDVEATRATGPPRNPAVAPPTAFEARNVRLLRNFFLGRALIVPFFVGALVALGRPEGRLLLASVGLGALALASVRFFQIHYQAPITGAVFGLVALGLARIDTWRPAGAPVGSVLAALAVAATFAGLLGDVERVPSMHTAFGYDLSGVKRAAVIRELEASEGRDLVIVEYGPKHTPHHEFVYNGADIDASDIVWARDMGVEKNRALLEHFKDRRVWWFRDGFGRDLDGLSPRS